jgi:DNA-binding FadR family transcriptional regulator
MAAYSERGLHGRIVHTLGRRILSGELKPGHVFDLAEVERDFGVSRTAVREAMKVLAAKGLVESRPKIGTRVRSRHDWNLLDPDVLAWQFEAGLSARFLQDTLELRGLIEPGAARLAALRATDEEIEQLAEACEQMADAAVGDLDTWLEPDLRFHALLLQASHNELLEHMSVLVGSVLRLLFTFSSRPPQTFVRATPLHSAIVDAIRDRDPDAAELAVLRLLEDTETNVERALAEA